MDTIHLHLQTLHSQLAFLLSNYCTGLNLLVRAAIADHLMGLKRWSDSLNSPYWLLKKQAVYVCTKHIRTRNFNCKYGGWFKKTTCPPPHPYYIFPHQVLLWYLVLVTYAEIWWDSMRFYEIQCHLVRFSEMWDLVVNMDDDLPFWTQLKLQKVQIKLDQKLA